MSARAGHTQTLDDVQFHGTLGSPRRSAVLGMTTPEPLSYVAGLIAAHAAGHTGDHMHLGWFSPQHDGHNDALGRAQTYRV